MKLFASYRHVVGGLSRLFSASFTKSTSSWVPAHRSPICRIALLLLAASIRLYATEFYASPTGTGTGTLASPWALMTALTTSAIRPGDTLWLRGGTYQVGGKPFRYNCSLAGSSSNYITVRNYNNERAIIDGSVTHQSGGYVIFRGLEVTSSVSGRYTSETGSWPALWRIPNGLGQITEYCVAGIQLQAPYDKVINCYIHDCIGGGIVLWTTAPGAELTGNIINMNGWVAPDRTHGHGIYAQNTSTNPRKLVRDNIMLNNADHGAQFYGSDTAPTCNMDILGNIFADNGALYPNNVAGGCNVLVGSGAITYNNTFVGNSVWRTPGTKGDSSADHYQGYDQNTVGLAVLNNFIVANSTYNIGTDSKVTGNTFIGANHFGHGMSTGTFPANTYATARPTTGVFVSLRPNAYEAGRANFAIYNWSGAATVNVDISSLGYKSGDTFELHNAQDYYGDVKTYTYSTGTIVVPMTGHTVAQPIAAPKPVSTFPNFGSFIIFKTGTGTGSTPPSNGNSTPPSNGNTAPTVSTIANQSISVNTAVGPLAFTIGDGQTSAGSLLVSASSSNPTLLPSSGIALGWTDNSHHLITLTPAANQTGSATISVTVSDGVLSTATSFTLTVVGVANSTLPAGLPSPWQTQDIGAGGIAGSAGYSSGVFTVAGAGLDIGGAADQFRYVYQLASGDCDIRARVMSVQNTDASSKAGVMIRESLNVNSTHVSMLVTPSSGGIFQQRASTGATSTTIGTIGLTAPYWVRLVRSGNTLTGYSSVDGATWTTTGWTTITMAANVYIGLAVTSHANGWLCTSTINNVTAVP